MPTTKRNEAPFNPAARTGRDAAPARPMNPAPPAAHYRAATTHGHPKAARNKANTDSHAPHNPKLPPQVTSSTVQVRIIPARSQPRPYKTQPDRHTETSGRVTAVPTPMTASPARTRQYALTEVPSWPIPSTKAPAQTRTSARNTTQRELTKQRRNTEHIRTPPRAVKPQL